MTASRSTTLGPLRSVPSFLVRRAPSPVARRSALLCGGIGLLTVVTMLGDLLSPALRHRHPLLLMLLTPRTPYLVAAADDVPFPLFLLGAVVRLCAADPLHFVLGRTTGPAGMATASRLAGRARGSRMRLVRQLGQLSQRAPASTSSPLWLAGVVASPTAKSMLVTGAAGVRAPGVALADVVGTVLRVVVIWHAGRSFPVLARTCAAVVPWVVVPCAVVGAVVGLTRWRRRRTQPPHPPHPIGDGGPEQPEPAVTIHPGEPQPANHDVGCHSWVAPPAAVAASAASRRDLVA